MPSNAITSVIAIDTLCNGLYVYGAIWEGGGEGAGGGGAGLEDGRYGAVGEGASYGLEVGGFFGGVVETEAGRCSGDGVVKFFHGIAAEHFSELRVQA